MSNLRKKRILITGVAGFIGFHLCNKLLKRKNIKLFGIDNLNSYYDVRLKKNRLRILKEYSKDFIFYKIDLRNQKKLNENFRKNKYDIVINLAAQAGVRYSITHPREYIDSNIIGFYNLLEVSTKYKVKHFMFASTSSVYGDNKKMPLKENFNTNKPLSLYAATKSSNEALAHANSNIHKIPTTGLRFFTVYGPYGRPDMSLFKFTKNIINEVPIELFNKGNHVRDFTYVDDVVTAVSKLIFKYPNGKIPFDVFNIASSRPRRLKLFLSTIEKFLEKKSIQKKLGLQPGDIYKTHASIDKLKKATNFKPQNDIIDGINKFIKWYKSYY